MSVVGSSPAAVSTAGNVSLRAIALNVAQPNPSTAGTVLATDEPSTVSVRTVIKHQWSLLSK